MKFEAPVGGSKPIGKVRAIKDDLEKTLVENGMPKEVYLTISKAPIPGYDCIPGNPTISQSDGNILYHFGRSINVLEVAKGSMNGNFSLPKDPWTVSPADLLAYKKAKAEDEAAKKNKK
jgi:hypothetical protein